MEATVKEIQYCFSVPFHIGYWRSILIGHLLHLFRGIYKGESYTLKVMGDVIVIFCDEGIYLGVVFIFKINHTPVFPYYILSFFAEYPPLYGM